MKHASEWIGDQVIYEVNIRQYTEEGNLNAFTKHLPRLKELGVDILWLMPIFPISEKRKKGSLGSYYAVRDYKNINPEFGNKDDFRALVDMAHKLGFKVILDWVANHSGWDHIWIYEHPEYYTHVNGKIISPLPEWEDVADLNYDNPATRSAMIDALEYWVDEFDIDGYRCDMAAMVPTSFWEEARHIIEKNKPLFMLAEAWEPELTKTAFDVNYGWDTHHLLNDIASGKKYANELPHHFEKLASIYSTHNIIMNFIDNHDENSWNGSIFERMGKAHKVCALMIFTLDGMPLLYSGQEIGMDKRLKFFDKDPIEWIDNEEITQFYKQLIRLRKTNTALWTGRHSGNFEIIPQNRTNECFAFIRKNKENEVLVMANFSSERQYINLLKDMDGDYTSFFTNKEIRFNSIATLEPYDFIVLINEPTSLHK